MISKIFARRWSFLGRKSGTCAVPVTPDTPTDDEFVTAYEYAALSNGDTPRWLGHALTLATIRGAPDSVLATLRKLGAQ